MLSTAWQQYVQYTDACRDLVVPGNTETTISFCVDHFITLANKSIEDHGSFSVALSGGSTPKAIFQSLAHSSHGAKVDWSRVFLFWSDERPVPPSNPDSNYRMAMDAGLKLLPIPADHIFRMEAESHIEENALAYEQLLRSKCNRQPLDLITLGMGEDGHTASLFPNTEGLTVQGRLVIANFVPQKNCRRMTFTFEGIHTAKHICVYVIGSQKQHMLTQVLTGPQEEPLYPAQRIGTPSHRALWIADQAAASELITSLQ